MAHLNHSQTHSSATGSQEYYNTQRRRSESPYEMNGSAGGVTYGSPGSISDYKQALANLRREVEERRKNEAELQQTVNMLKAQYTASSANFLDPQYMGPEGSSGSENVDENLKDAHIKHLQRQVTVLQANLYKAGGWDSRASNAAKEKYQAMDEVTELKTQLSKIKEENEELRHRNEELTSAYHRAQQTLRQMEEQGFLPHDRDKLMDEISKQKIEIKTLKESLTRLDHENRTMKDTGSYDSNQGANSCAYSQELDYLHKVVDTLKKTVLDQRNCLLGMRHSGLGNSSSLPSSSKPSGNDGTHSGIGRRNNSSPTLKAAESSAGVSSAYRHPSPVAAPRTSITKENSQQSSQHGSLRMEGSYSRKLSSRELLEESEFDALNSPRLIVYHDEGAALGSGKPRQEVGVSKYPISTQGYNILVNSSEESTPTPHGLQQTSGASSAQAGANSSSNFSNGYIPMNSQQRKISQSEILGRRNIPEQSARSKTEIFGRNPELVPQETRKAPQWNYGMVEKDVSNGTVGELSPRHFPTSSAPQQAFMGTGLSVQAQLSSQGRLYDTSQGRAYETTPAPQETLLPEWDSGGAMNRNMVNTIQHVNTNVSGSQNNQIFHPPSTYHDASVRVVNQDMMAGGRMTIPPPSPHGALGQQNLYVNMARPGPDMPAAEVDTRPRLTSDRLCPVCNRDFSHVSMEDFQTHVFECFDDENAPETMKPLTQPMPDKTCPMCSAKFGPTTSQSDYEKHVHSHFGEEGPGDNFEILQP